MTENQDPQATAEQLVDAAKASAVTPAQWITDAAVSVELDQLETAAPTVEQEDPMVFGYIALMDDSLRVCTVEDLAHLLKQDYYSDDRRVMGLYAYQLNVQSHDMFRAEITTERNEVDEMEFIHFTSKIQVAGKTVDQFGWTVDGRA